MIINNAHAYIKYAFRNIEKQIVVLHLVKISGIDTLIMISKTVGS